MSARDLASALVAVLGIYFLGDSIRGYGFVVFHSFDEAVFPPSHWAHLFTAAFASVEIAFGAALVLLRNRIALRLFPDPSSIGAPIDLTDLQAAAFAVVGVYFVGN